MAGLIGLLFTIWTLVSADLTVTQFDGPVRFTDLYGSARTAEAALACPTDAAPILLLSDRFSVATLVHELAHAYDCQDNGVMDGSPISRPDQRPAWASEYCWAADAEWYACAVVQYRTLFPDEVAPWGHEEAVPAPVAVRTRDQLAARRAGGGEGHATAGERPSGRDASSRSR